MKQSFDCIEFSTCGTMSALKKFWVLECFKYQIFRLGMLHLFMVCPAFIWPASSITIPTISTKRVPEAFLFCFFFTMKFLHSPTCVAICQMMNASNKDLFLCNRRHWIPTFCLFSFGWSSKSYFLHTSFYLIWNFLLKVLLALEGSKIHVEWIRRLFSFNSFVLTSLSFLSGLGAQ